MLIMTTRINFFTTPHIALITTTTCDLWRCGELQRGHTEGWSVIILINMRLHVVLCGGCVIIIKSVLLLFLSPTLHRVHQSVQPYTMYRAIRGWCWLHLVGVGWQVGQVEGIKEAGVMRCCCSSTSCGCCHIFCSLLAAHMPGLLRV